MLEIERDGRMSDGHHEDSWHLEDDWLPSLHHLVTVTTLTVILLMVTFCKQVFI